MKVEFFTSLAATAYPIFQGAFFLSQGFSGTLF
jgi:hypothetical protein